MLFIHCVQCTEYDRAKFNKEEKLQNPISSNQPQREKIKHTQPVRWIKFDYACSAIDGFACYNFVCFLDIFDCLSLFLALAMLFLADILYYTKKYLGKFSVSFI